MQQETRMGLFRTPHQERFPRLKHKVASHSEVLWALSRVTRSFRTFCDNLSA